MGCKDGRFIHGRFVNGRFTLILDSWSRNVEIGRFKDGRFFIDSWSRNVKIGRFSAGRFIDGRFENGRFYNLFTSDFSSVISSPPTKSTGVCLSDVDPFFLHCRSDVVLRPIRDPYEFD